MDSNEERTPWELVSGLCKPDGPLAMSAYLDAPTPIRTGFDKLDQLLSGGLTRGVTVIGGTSSSGKSSMGSHLTSTLTQRGYRVVYASYEMSWDVVQLRCASAWSTIYKHDNFRPFSWSQVVNGSYRSGNERYRGRTRAELSRIMYEYPDDVVKALNAWEDGPGRNLAVLTGGDNVVDLTNTMRTLNRHSPGTILIVDYIQIVPPSDSKIRDEYERVTDVINHLQAYAMGEHGGNVIAISSTKKLTEADYKQGPSMDWFRGSGYIGYASEQAVMLVPDREEVTGENGAKVLRTSRNADGSLNERMTVVKNKSGMTDFSIAVKLYGGYCRFI